MIHLTLMELKLLRYLIEHEGRTVSRKTILEDVWDLQEDTDTRAIDNFIVRLRRHLEDEPNDPKIYRPSAASATSSCNAAQSNNRRAITFISSRQFSCSSNRQSSNRHVESMRGEVFEIRGESSHAGATR